MDRATIEKIRITLDKNVIPWSHRVIDGERYYNYNGVNNVPYSNQDDLMLSVESNVMEFNDPRWYSFDDVKQMGHYLKAGSKGVKVENMVLFNGEQVQGLEPFTGETNRILHNKNFCREIYKNAFQSLGIEDANGDYFGYDATRNCILSPLFKLNYYATDVIICSDKMSTMKLGSIITASGHDTLLNRFPSHWNYNEEMTNYINNDFDDSKFSILTKKEELIKSICISLMECEVGLKVEEQLDIIDYKPINWFKSLSDEQFIEAIEEAVKAKEYILQTSNYSAVKERLENGEFGESRSPLALEKRDVEKSKSLVDEITSYIPMYEVNRHTVQSYVDERSLYVDDNKVLTIVEYDQDRIPTAAWQLKDNAFELVKGSEVGNGLTTKFSSRKDILVINDGLENTLAYQKMADVRVEYLLSQEAANAPIYLNNFLDNIKDSDRYQKLKKVVIALSNTVEGNEATEKIEQTLKNDYPHIQIQIHQPITTFSELGEQMIAFQEQFKHVAELNEPQLEL